MTHDLSANGKQIKLTLHDEALPILRDLTAERLSLGMRQGQDPSAIDLALLRIPDERPYVLLSAIEDVNELGNRFMDYANNASRAATELQMALPPELANPFVQERLSRAEIAGRVALELFDEYDVQLTIGVSRDVPLEWFE